MLALLRLFAFRRYWACDAFSKRLACNRSLRVSQDATDSCRLHVALYSLGHLLFSARACDAFSKRLACDRSLRVSQDATDSRRLHVALCSPPVRALFAGLRCQSSSALAAKSSCYKALLVILAVNQTVAFNVLCGRLCCLAFRNQFL